MPRSLLTAVAVLVPAVVAAGSFALPAAAAGRSVAPPAQMQAEGLSLDEAVARVEARYGARAVRAEEDREDDRRVYRIRLLSPDGRVFEVTVDAVTGDVE